MAANKDKLTIAVGVVYILLTVGFGVFLEAGTFDLHRIAIGGAVSVFLLRWIPTRTE